MRLVIVDPSLKDNRGHHFSLTRVIASCAISDGYDVVVFSNMKVTPDVCFPGARLRPVFSLSMYDYFQVANRENDISYKDRLRQAIIARLPEFLIEPLKRLRNRVKRVIRYFPKDNKAKQLSEEPPPVRLNVADELYVAMQDESITAQDIVLVHTSDAIIYRSVLQLIQKNYPGGHPSYHLCTPYDDEIMPHAEKGLSVGRVVRLLKLLGALNRYVFLYAENPLLAKKLSSDWCATVETLDIPLLSYKSPVLESFAGSATLRVVYLGAARDEKGFNKIPGIIDEALKLNDFDVEFVIQCSAQLVGYNAEIRATIKKLQGFSDSRVTLIHEQQSMDDYYSLLESADVVLACYQKDRYEVRGSGVVTEAVVYGKNIVTTPGTYPAWLAGDAAVEASTSREIAQAIYRIYNNLTMYQEKARKRSIWFAEKTNPDKYVNKLVSMVLLGQKRQKEQGITVVSTSGAATASTYDASEAENPYNGYLQNADVSENGNPLYVKSISDI